MVTKSNILVVEDDMIIGADLVQALELHGYSAVGPIPSGELALQKLESTRPDLILMDIHLSGKLDGIRTAEILQQKTALPIVFLTGLTDDENFQRAKLLNPYGYLIKPFDPTELRSTIELTLHRFKAHAQEPQHDDDSSAEAFTSPALNSTLGEHATIEAALIQLPLFQGIPVGEISSFARQSSIRSLDSGQFIAWEDGESSGGFIPLSGRIGLTKTSASGKDLIVSLVAPGSIAGLQFSLPEFNCGLTACAKMPSRMVWIPFSVWQNFRDKHPILERRLNASLALHLASSYELASSLVHASVEDRLIKALMLLLPQFGKSSAGTAGVGRIYITRRELAELTGTTPETAYRVTKHLERENLIDLTRPGILKILDVAALGDYAAKH